MACEHWDRLAIFDVDGVLINSRPLVEEAYKLAGVDMPPDAWGKPWHDWLPQYATFYTVQELRARKHREYMRLLKTRSNLRLPPADVAEQLELENHAVKFVTGASSDIVPYVLTAVNLNPMGLVASELGLPGKAVMASLWARRGWNVVYVDDDPELKNVKFVRWVRYIGQDAETLRKEMEDAWTRSS